MQRCTNVIEARSFFAFEFLPLAMQIAVDIRIAIQNAGTNSVRSEYILQGSNVKELETKLRLASGREVGETCLFRASECSWSLKFCQ
jgi:hypothetical protein